MTQKLPKEIYYVEVNDYEAAWPVAFFYDKKKAEEHYNNYVLDKSKYEIAKRGVTAKIT